MNAIDIMYLMAEAAASAETPEQPSAIASILSLVLPLAFMVLIFWLFIIRPEKKRNKETQDILNSIQVADKVVTTGGIVGRVLSISDQDDTVLIETGSDRTKIRVIKAAIARNDTQHEETASKENVKKSKGKKEIK